MHGLDEHGYNAEFDAVIVGEIRGSSEYGVPDSNAASAEVYQIGQSTFANATQPSAGAVGH